jgi:PDZ domain-containing protein
MLTVAALIVVAVFAASAWPTKWYETAPGSASLVKSRLEISDAETYDDTGQILFVTAGGAPLTPFMAFVGWLDPVVDVRTCKQAGVCGVPQQQIHQVNLGAMASAKQIAEYVALSRLGFDATLDEGSAQVDGFDPSLCPADAAPDTACKVLDVGDTIVAVDGEPTATLSDVAAAIAPHKPGDTVTLTVTPYQSTDRVDKQVTLVAAPDDATRTIIGFSPRDTRTVSVPVTVDIDTAEIGGPSAGLAFTLALIDALTPGPLTGDTKVAVTGTIDAEGNVGAIGALPQKADAVRRSGATLFLVPAGQGADELARAREVAGPGVEIETVATLDDALAAIAAHGGQENPLPAATQS